MILLRCHASVEIILFQGIFFSYHSQIRLRQNAGRLVWRNVERLHKSLEWHEPSSSKKTWCPRILLKPSQLPNMLFAIIIPHWGVISRRRPPRSGQSSNTYTQTQAQGCLTGSMGGGGQMLTSHPDTWCKKRPPVSCHCYPPSAGIFTANEKQAIASSAHFSGQRPVKSIVPKKIEYHHLTV